MSTIWVVSASKKPVHLTDSSTPGTTSGYFRLDIDERMAKEDIPVQVPDNAYFNNVIHVQKLLNIVIDASAAKKANDQFFKKVSAENMERNKKTGESAEIAGAVAEKVQAIVEKSLSDATKREKKEPVQPVAAEGKK